MGHDGAVALLSTDQLRAGLELIECSPADKGVVELIARRPALDEREVIDVGELTPHEGLAGDNWSARGSRHTPDGSAETDRQLTIMNARAIALFAGSRDRWALAGDQLYVDLDLSSDNLPAGSRLRIGDALIEVSPAPHNGCAKFSRRFGAEVTRFVNTPDGKRLRLRGLNAVVVEPGLVRCGDVISKVG
jgi:MOSC domain-containing protein YiiM